MDDTALHSRIRNAATAADIDSAVTAGGIEVIDRRNLCALGGRGIVTQFILRAPSGGIWLCDPFGPALAPYSVFKYATETNVAQFQRNPGECHTCHGSHHTTFPRVCSRCKVPMGIVGACMSRDHVAL